METSVHTTFTYRTSTPASGLYQVECDRLACVITSIAGTIVFQYRHAMYEARRRTADRIVHDVVDKLYPEIWRH